MTQNEIEILKFHAEQHGRFDLVEILESMLEPEHKPGISDMIVDLHISMINDYRPNRD